MDDLYLSESSTDDDEEDVAERRQVENLKRIEAGEYVKA